MIKIFYDYRQDVPGLDSYSPSASKPGRFVQLAGRHGFTDVEDFAPITHAHLNLVHSPDYVTGVFSGKVLNGFENNDWRVPQACLWTIGSLLAAAKHAIANPFSPVCSPTSGFHHAHTFYGGGFCTFNGLMVVVATLRLSNPGLRVAILDCDMHTGDGTADILRHHPALDSNVLHITQGPAFEPGDSGEDFQAWLDLSIQKINEFEPDLVLYQAGADPHVNDPLGGLLTNQELYARDAAVFEGIRAPIVWNLAGGYQPNPGGTIHTDPVLRIHLYTLLAARASIPTRIQLYETKSCPTKNNTRALAQTH